jgi:hypothetical protein
MPLKVGSNLQGLFYLTAAHSKVVLVLKEAFYATRKSRTMNQASYHSGIIRWQDVRGKMIKSLPKLQGIL